MLVKIEGGRRRVWQRMIWLDSTTNSMDMSLSRLRDHFNHCAKSPISKYGHILRYWSLRFQSMPSSAQTVIAKTIDWGLKQQKIYLLTVWKLEVWDERASMVRFLWELSSRTADGYLLPVSSHGRGVSGSRGRKQRERERERKREKEREAGSSDVPSYKGTKLTIKALSSWSCLNLITSNSSISKHYHIGD